MVDSGGLNMGLVDSQHVAIRRQLQQHHRHERFLAVSPFDRDQSGGFKFPQRPAFYIPAYASFPRRLLDVKTSGSWPSTLHVTGESRPALLWFGRLGCLSRQPQRHFNKRVF